jgi:hypothetical protein
MSPRSFALKFRWNVRALQRNPLIRASDRLEALSFLVLFVMTLLAIPFATHVGDQTYDSTMRFVHEETQSRHSVRAVVVQGSTALPTDFSTPLYVTVQWRDGARQRTEQIVSPGTVETGAELTVWLDPAGKVVTAPLTSLDASVNAASAGWTVWTVAVVFCGLLGLAIRKVLDRARARSWERALQMLAIDDDGWANRRT